MDGKLWEVHTHSLNTNIIIMEENWYLITSESILIESHPTMMVSSSITLTETNLEVTESLYSGSITESLYSVSITESLYSGSILVFNSSSVVPTDIMWSLNESLILFGTHQTYTGSYSSSFDDYDSVISWIWDLSTKEYLNWSDDDDPDNDPYGIDGPFPEEMDETII
jgi:outer membrane protease